MKLSNLAKRMIVAILIVTLVCLIGSVLYYRSLGFFPFLFGLVLGSGVSIAKVILLERAVDKALSMDKERAGTYVSIHHLFRLLLTGIALFIGAVVPQISLWGAAAGIFAYQVALYTSNFQLNETKH